jgi:hypothetical protein
MLREIWADSLAEQSGFTDEKLGENIMCRADHWDTFDDRGMHSISGGFVKRVTVLG